MPHRTLLVTSFKYDDDLGLYSCVGLEMRTAVCGSRLAAAAERSEGGSSALAWTHKELLEKVPARTWHHSGQVEPLSVIFSVFDSSQ